MFPSFGHLRTRWGSYQAYVQTCFLLSCLPHVNNLAVFSCSTQVLEDILCDQRPTSGLLDIVPSGGGWCHRGSSGLAVALAPPWNIHRHPSVVQHQVQNGAKPLGGLWVVGGLVADHRGPAVLSCVSPFLTLDGPCLRSCFSPCFSQALD